jgi:deoxyguanosine kinase
MKYDFIAIEGNIGAGKTTLATRLAAHHNARLILEQFADNPFLPKFYAEPEKHAFPLELSFLAERYHQLKDLLAAKDLFRPVTISDYFIDKSLIFARATLGDDEFALYSRLFQIIHASLPRPDLLIYLYVDVERAQQNIRKRGREYEQKIPDEYLQRIQAGYLEHLKKLPDMRILVIDTTGLDFVNEPDDFEKINRCLVNDYKRGITRVSP